MASTEASTSYQPWQTREGWTDITPIPQDDGPNPLVPILYTEDYRDAMDAFRFIASKGEKSPRVLELTEAIIRSNPGHYSVWAYRSETLLSIGADLEKELELMDDLVREHLKSYQVWQHRRTVVTALDSPEKELPFTSKALAIDAKNYHTWAYRQWVLCHFYGPSSERVECKEVWEGEMTYVEGLLASDIRNNSAWNHRFFICFEIGWETSQPFDRELEYAAEMLDRAPNNASVWSYARGILRRAERPLSTWSDKATKYRGQAVAATCFLADAAAENAKSGSKSEEADEAKKLYSEMCTLDPIRQPLYEMKIRKLGSRK